MDITERIGHELFEFQDMGYRDLQSKLMPDYPKENIIGIRIPVLKKYAARAAGYPGIEAFLAGLPHRYYEENNLHAFIIMREKDFDKALEEVERLLPFVDNWATCDSILPKAFAKESEKLLPHIRRWTASDRTYTVRYAIGCLMRYFLNDKFREEYLEIAASVRSEEYYINMMIAWYFATALAKQYDAALPYLTERRLPEWVHKKTIQKSCESFRVTDEHKQFLRTLR